MSFLTAVCPWPLAGLLIGLLTVTLQWVDNLPLGATGAAAGFVGWARKPSAGLTWRALFFLGLIAGGAVYAGLTRAAPAGWAYPALDRLFGGALPPKAVWLSVAGLFIGFGARWAGGCTSGHGICGVGRLQSGSLATTVTFVVTAVLVAHLVWRGSPP
jgi:uncharacterized protein